METVLELIVSGVAVDEQDSFQKTALIYACEAGNYEVAHQLLDAGADPDVHQSNALIDTPLSAAAAAGHFDLVRLLIAHGANPNVYAGMIAVRAECHARRNGFPQIAEFLRECEEQAYRRERGEKSSSFAFRVYGTPLA